MRIFAIALCCFLYTCTNAQTFKNLNTSAGRLGVNFTNTGTVGRPDVVANSKLGPSMEYPIGSGIEHLFEGGLWLGCMVNGQVQLSSSAIESARGYSTGATGYEFTPNGLFGERSTLPSSSNYRSDAVSHQDFVINFTDKNTIVPGTSQPINGHTQPLYADVNLQTYCWNYSFTDYFVILDYTITNNSTHNWDSIWIGYYSDMLVRNVNVTQETGTAFFNKGRNGWDSIYKSIYTYEQKGDDIDYTRSYGSVMFLGSDWRNMYFHPSNAAVFTSAGLPAPQVLPNFWNYGGTNPPFAKPNDDIERYYKLQTGLSAADIYGATGPVNFTNNWIQLLSAGPYVQLKQGETIRFALALVCAKQLGALVNNEAVDDADARKELVEHWGWAKRTYSGEDLNENGKLDAAEDINGNNKLDRYILPEPPATPTVKIVPSNNKVDIYWDDAAEKSIDPLSKKQDFEGYRIYRTNAGDDLKLNLLDVKKLIQQWDKPSNNVGNNNGFAAVKMAAPVKFEGDTTTYTYHITIDNLLNGWQYLFIITSFDAGDDAIGLQSLESSLAANDFRVFTGTAPVDGSITIDSLQPGVYPNPYKTNAAWDGTGSRSKKIYFYNLPAHSEIVIYTTAGDVVRTLKHDAATYTGSDIKWYADLSSTERFISPGGEHAWDLLSDSKNTISQGVYFFTVKDLDKGIVKTGKFVVLK
ncbi:MAG: hypothetical protein SGJ10_06325 [Bacteroidota bacterium]|nr:hypothetical protein [Bacteroidota bacterium]